MIVQLQFHCIEFEVSKVIKREKTGNPNLGVLQSFCPVSKVDFGVEPILYAILSVNFKKVVKSCYLKIILIFV